MRHGRRAGAPTRRHPRHPRAAERIGLVNAALGNMQEQQEVIEAQREGAREADEVTMAAIQH
ncbi:MAG: hypothetical protein ABJA34_13780, partial [Pseudonocardiales bacterium]